MHIYTHSGGYGCNNVGDEAILEGLRRQYPSAIEVYVCKSRDPHAIWYADLLEGRVKFEAPGELIIGGGGIWHAKQALVDQLELAKLAKIAGLKVSLQGVGLEGYQDEWEHEAKELLSLCHAVMVRTQTSVKIVRRLGFKAEHAPDFAYGLANVLRYKDIGVSINAVTNEDEYRSILEDVRAILQHANVTLIPHSRAWVTASNNDLVVAHRLWSDLNLWPREQETTFSFLSDVGTPSDTLKAYAKMDGVYTARYHGCIFADMARIPFSIKAPGKKLQAFADDYNGKLLTKLDSIDELVTWVKTI